MTRPNFIEAEAIQRAITWAEATGGRLYIVHMSTAQGADHVKAARARGVDVYAETCASIWCSTTRCSPGRTAIFTRAARRSRRRATRTRLWKGLHDGEVSVVSTDTCTFTRAQKARWEGDWTKIPMGLPGLETLLPIVYTHGVLGGRADSVGIRRQVLHQPGQADGSLSAERAHRRGQRRRHRDHRSRRRRSKSIARKMETNADWSPYQGWPLAGSRKRRSAAAGRSSTTTTSSARAAGAAGCRASARARSKPRELSQPRSADGMTIARGRRFRRDRRERSRRCSGLVTSIHPERLKERFADVPPPLSLDQARVEAARCLYCFDAPCTRACPTHIDVPGFIRQILHHDELSAARTILDANVFGGSCARACPTEVLCEGACVDRMLMKTPVQIGRLQRMRCDAAGEQGFAFFEAGQADGKAGCHCRVRAGRAFRVPFHCAAGTRRDGVRGARSAGRARYAGDRGLQDLD